MPSWIRKYTKARDTWNKQKARYYKKHRPPQKNRTWFDPYEAEQIMGHKITDVELSKILKRSVQSIQTKRWKIKTGYFMSHYDQSQRNDKEE